MTPSLPVPGVDTHGVYTVVHTYMYILSHYTDNGVYSYTHIHSFTYRHTHILMHTHTHTAGISIPLVLVKEAESVTLETGTGPQYHSSCCSDNSWPLVS